MKHKFSVSLTLALIAAMLVTSLALADNVKNDVVVGGTDTIYVGGTTIISYKIDQQPFVQDGQNGCNAADGTPAVVSIITPLGVTATPTVLTFTNCTTWQSVSFTASSSGNYPISASVSDGNLAGGTYDTTKAAFILHVLAPTDSTPPVITPSVSGTMGNNGWYVSDVTVSWTVVDNESAITSKPGCDPTTINADTAGTTLTCSATSAGGTSSQSVTIKRDATAPTGVSGAPNRVPDHGTWYNHAVDVVFTGSDATSGIASCTTTTYSGPDGASVSVNGSCTDNAGNTSASVASSAFNYDATAPAVSASASPAANANGWNNTDVTVSFSGSDSLSGIASCDAPVVLSSEGAGQSASGYCYDKAGNKSDKAEVTGINIDKTAPNAPTANVSPAPNGAGWNKTDVTVSFSSNGDAGTVQSGIAGCTASSNLTSETAGTTVKGTCTDKAGNTSAEASVTVKIDKTAPVFESGSVSPNPVILNGSATASATWNGDISGVASQSCGTVDTSTVGSHTVTCTATDNAGNTATKNLSYNVNYNFDGFFKPVDNLPTLNLAKAGQAIPLKWRLTDANGLPVLNLTSVKVTVIGLSCTAGTTIDQIEEYAAGASGLQNLGDGYYQFNWKTPTSYASSCKTLYLDLGDGADPMHTALFQFRK